MKKIDFKLFMMLLIFALIEMALMLVYLNNKKTILDNEIEILKKQKEAIELSNTYKL